ILNKEADIVIGDRHISEISHFSIIKKFLQQWGSWVVRLASGTDVPDATSGFRAFSRESALRLSILSTYTYTLETIIQASKKGLVITFVSIQVNAPLRQSRLIKNNWSYIKKSAATILRIYALYEPFRTFIYLSLPFLSIGIGLLIRFGFFYFIGERGIGRFVQSIVVGGTFLIIGFLMLVLGILSDLIAANRRLTEEMLYQLRRREYNKN
ncbi:MAG: glycosyltransferase family 2 protein, partial [Anaerolineae bacterium]|nr:glycosyltransferase family 2 protein [Anaerolineae bacterium]